MRGLKLGNPYKHLNYQATSNYPISLTGFSMGATYDFDLCQYGHISYDDIIFRIKYLEDTNELEHIKDAENKIEKIEYSEETKNSLGAFERIEIYYCDKCIGKRLFNLDKIKSVNGIFKLSDVFPGIRFNVYNSPNNKITIRFQRNPKDYRFKEFSVEYDKNFNRLDDIIKFEDSVILKQNVYYHTNSGEQVMLYVQFKDGSLHDIQDTPFTLYLNDERLESPYEYIVFNMPGKHYIELEHPEDCGDYIYIQKIIGSKTDNIHQGFD
jgi:hypothetical protein